MPDSMPALIGRVDVLAALREAYDGVRAGAGGCLVFTGPAGIGKTRLLAETAREAAAVGLTVAAGRATQLDRAAPLHTLLHTLRSALPAVTADTAPAGRFGLLDRLGEAVEMYTRSQPLLIAIDDAQWADELSASALRLLVPLLASSPVLWLLARRSAPARSPGQNAVDALVAMGARETQLPPLGPDDMDRMCAELLGHAPDAAIRALAARSGGNPFLLEQLVLAVREGTHVPAVPADGSREDDLPPTLRAAITQRLNTLSAETRRLLQAGAVLRRPFTVHAVATLTGEHPGSVLPLVDEATRADVLTDVGAELDFRHELLRQAVYDQTPEVFRAVLHREAAAVSRAEGRSAVEVVEHLIRGGAGGRDLVATLRDAVNSVADDGPDTAADLMTRALPLVHPDDSDRPELVAEAVRLLANCGRLVAAQQLGSAALHAGLGAATAARLSLGLAEALKHAGDNRAVLSYTGPALERGGVPAALRSQLLAIRSHAHLCLEEMELADETGAQAVALGAACDEAPSAVFGMVARTVVARSRGDLRSAIEHAEAAVRLADEAAGAARHRHPRLWLASALVAIDAHAEADETLTAARRESEQFGTAWALPLWHYFRSSLLLGAGRLDDAKAEAEAGLLIAEQLSARQLMGPLLGVLIRVATRHDDLPTATTLLERASAEPDTGVPSKELPWARALLQETTGDLAGALRTLDGLFSWSPGQLLLLTAEPEAAPALVRIARAADAGDLAAAAAAAAQALADANPGVVSLAGAAEHATGLLHDDPDRLAAAVKILQPGLRRLALAAALEDAGRAELMAGERESGLRRLEESLELYVRYGARRDAARLQKRLREQGVRRQGLRTAGTPDASGRLTPSELRVALLVAEGLSNRQVAERLYLSPHTVDSHLRHTFVKLGLRSRVELTRLMLAADQ